MREQTFLSAPLVTEVAAVAGYGVQACWLYQWLEVSVADSADFVGSRALLVAVGGGNRMREV
ncbi:MAG: hypothetical protein OJF49_003403 [Ktedonobacterales bacterium]|nr:MAG: hypothetical protein OJF49_003403 [Ktedonobacterales bacterium]